MTSLRERFKKGSLLFAPLLLLFLPSCKKDLQEQLLNENQITANSLATTSTAVPAVLTKIEAEYYTTMSGVKTEGCNEGTSDIGYIDAGDWMNYDVSLSTATTYNISFRVAGFGGQLQLKNSVGTVLTTVDLPSTGGYQTWTTVSTTAVLPAGQQTLRIYASKAGWNLNWWLISTPNNLIYSNSFESQNDFPSTPGNETNGLGNESGSSSGVTLTNASKRSGNYAVRFELNKSDAINYSIERAELVRKSETQSEMWYGASNYFPSTYILDPEPEIVFQWHDSPDWNLGETWRSPPVAMEIINDHFKLVVLYSADPVNNYSNVTKKEFDLGPVDKSVWIDWAIHVKFSYQTDGVLEIWKNKQKVISYLGPNCYNDQNLPYFKFGIYKWSWETSTDRAKSPEDKRVFYYDELRIGNKYSSLAEVSPNG